jgi:filamentous hemagglutinin family protein
VEFVNFPHDDYFSGTFLTNQFFGDDSKRIQINACILGNGMVIILTIRRFVFSATACAFILYCGFNDARADVVTDGSLGSAAALSGPDYAITENLGQRSGTNLFHSFSEFNLETSERATFSGSSAITNVIARVTGGVSTIDGTVASTIGAADVFLINPSGIVFGSNASLDLGGSFHASTADELVFADGTRFSGELSGGSVLSSAVPSAFGFLGGNPAFLLSFGILDVDSGKSLTLTSGSLAIDNSVLSAPGGQIQLASVAGAGDIALPGANQVTSPVSSFSDLSVIDATVSIDSPGGGGTLQIQGGEVIIDNSSITAGVTGSGTGGTLTINATGDLDVSNFSLVAADTTANGNAGTVEIAVGRSLNITFGGLISGDTFASGTAGSISVTAGNIFIDEAGADSVTGIASDSLSNATGNGGTVTVGVEEAIIIISGGEIGSSTFGAGNAGSVVVSAENIIIDELGADQVTGIFSQSNGATGGAGAVTVVARDTLIIDSGGVVSSSTFGSGDAGSVTVNADSLFIDSNASGFATGITSNSNGTQTTNGQDGNAGNVIVAVIDAISIGSGGVISSTTFGSGDGGEVTVQAGTILIDREGSGQVSGIISQSDFNSSGNAGSVDVQVDGALVIVGGGTINSATLGSGNAGSVTVNAGDLVIANGDFNGTTGISSDTDILTTGTGGDVSVIVDGTLTIEGGGFISSSTSGQGDAGLVTVDAENLVIDGQGQTRKTGIFSESNFTSTGNAGSVTVSVSDILIIENGGSISGSTFDIGVAGDVTVDAGTLFIDGQSSNLVTGILSQTNNVFGGNAGSVKVGVKEALTLNAGGVISSSTFGIGDAGSVTVDAKNLTIAELGVDQFTGISSQANPGSFGSAGSVTVSVGELININSDGNIGSDTFGAGDAGTVTVDAGRLSINALGANAFTGISSNTTFGATGDAGTVSVNVDGNLVLSNGGAISSASVSSGEAGQVVVKADGISILSGGQISSQSFSSGNGGNVSVTSLGEINLNGAGANTATGISASATGTGSSGSISVTTSAISIVSGGEVSTQAVAGTGGAITVTASDYVFIDGASITSSVADGTGGGGDITISKPLNLVLRNGNILARADAGDGGNLTISADQILSIEGNRIDASSRLGVDGQVIVNATPVQTAGETVVLETGVLDVSDLARDACATRGDRPTSSLVPVGRGGLPQDGGAPLSSSYFVDRSVDLVETNDRRRVSTRSKRTGEQRFDAACGS